MWGKFSMMKHLTIVDPLSLHKSKITYFHTFSVCLMVIAPSSKNFMSIGGISHFFMKTGWSDLKKLICDLFHVGSTLVESESIERKTRLSE